MIKYQEYFYRTSNTRFFLFDETIMLNTLEDVEVYLLRFLKVKGCNPNVGHFVIKVMDPYISNKDYPEEKEYYKNIYEIKEFMSKNSTIRWLYISPDVKQIYAECIHAEWEYKDERFKSDMIHDTEFIFDYGLMYGNYPILKPGNIYKTTFFNEVTEWDFNLSDFIDNFPELTESDNDALYIQECSDDLGWLEDLKNDKFEFGKGRVGYDFKLITKDFKSAYVDGYETMIVPVASIAPAEDGICAQYNGKEFDTFLGVWE